MNFDFPETSAAQARQRVEMLRLVFLLWKEKAMPGRPSVTVSEPTKQLRVFRDPPPDAAICHGRGRFSQLGFVMIGNAKQDVCFFANAAHTTAVRLEQVRKEPAAGPVNERFHSQFGNCAFQFVVADCSCGVRSVRFQAAFWEPFNQRKKPNNSATFMVVNIVPSRK